MKNTWKPPKNLLVFNLWRASNSEELAPKDAGRKGLLSCFPVPVNHILRLANRILVDPYQKKKSVASRLRR